MSLVSGCTNAQDPPKTKKILVAYYSRTGNTQETANQIHQIIGGDLFRIQTAKPYPEDYDAMVKQATKERESGYS